jgi:predicted oxidoreductase
MKTMLLPQTDLQVSQILYGCMQIGGKWDKSPVSKHEHRQAISIIRTALDEGINFFDHADIYCLGKSEQAFAGVWSEVPHLRDKIVLQTKCGIRFAGDPVDSSPARYDFSYEHIIHSVNNSLSRLQTDYVDILLLHRPDPLVEPEEVARAFDQLHRSGKVRYFGVSNHTAAQISLLRRFLNQPLVVDQIELNVIHSHVLNAGVVFNQNQPPLPVRGEGTFEYCRQHDITIQAWSPLALGSVSGKPISDPNSVIAKVARLVKTMADEKNASQEAILVAWLMRLPGQVQPVIGTTNLDRIHAACQGDSLALNREEWYLLFTAGRGAPLP